MSNYKYNLNFRIEKRKSFKDGDELPINADITFCGKRIFYFIGHRVAENQWDKDAQTVRRNNFNQAGVSASDIKARMSRIRTAVDSVFSTMEHLGITPTPNSVREALRKELAEEKVTRKTVGEYYRMLIDERDEERRVDPKTAKWSKPTSTKHNTILTRLNEFRRTLYFEDVTVELLEKFEVFLIQKNLTNAYVTQLMKSMKGFFNWATKKGYNANLAFKDYTPKFRDDSKKSGRSNRFPLTIEDLEAIKAFQTPSHAIDRTRNVFLFCCYSGMRFGDAMQMRWCDIINDCVDFVAEKTNQRIAFPLNNFLRSILAKYGPAENPEDRVFPQISNQKFNEQMKIVGQLAGLTDDWKLTRQVGNHVDEKIVPRYAKLSSHLGRHTFTSRASSLGAPSETIRSITGHTTDKMMGNYVHLSMKDKQGLMDKLDGSEPDDVKANVEPASVYDFAKTKNDERALQRMLSIPAKKEYFAQVEKDPVMAQLHLAVYLWNIEGAAAASKYIDRLPKTRLSEFYQLLAATQSWKR
ncbi:MAG: site-specific integrase [Bacteroidales bacterium]|nr:site-specific integrase [Bacteroidales bacterium]